MSRLSVLTNAIESIRSPIVRILAAVGVRPNHLTVLGALITVGAGYLAGQGELLPAGLVFFAGSLMDGLDGALARHTDSVSRTGAFLDSVLDRVGEAALLIGLSFHFAREEDVLAVVATTAALGLSMLVSYARARAESLGLNRGGFIPAPRPVRVAILAVGLVIAQPLIAVIAVAALSAVSAFQRIFAGMSGSEVSD